MNVNARLGPQPAEVVFHFRHVLPPGNPLGDLRIERLDPHFELQCTGREANNQLAK